MRLLYLLLVLLLAILAAVYWQRSADRKPPELKVVEPADAGLSIRLTDAAETFDKAAVHAESHTPLATALGRLSEECRALAGRAKADGDFASRNRTDILRLLFPLYGVVRRAAQLTTRTRTDEIETLLTSATAMIARAAEAFGETAAKAEATTLKRLEVDLEILEERLPDTDEA